MVHEAFLISRRFRQLEAAGNKDCTEIFMSLGQLIQNTAFITHESKERWAVFHVLEKIMIKLFNSSVFLMESGTLGDKDLNLLSSIYESALSEPQKMSFGFHRKKIGFTGVVFCPEGEDKHFATISSGLAFSVYVMATALLCKTGPQSNTDDDYLTKEISSKISNWEAFYGKTYTVVDAIKESDERLLQVLVSLDMLTKCKVNISAHLTPVRLFLTHLATQGFEHAPILDTFEGRLCISGTSCVYRMIRNLTNLSITEVVACFSEIWSEMQHIEIRHLYTTRRRLHSSGERHIVESQTYGIEEVKHLTFPVEEVNALCTKTDFVLQFYEGLVKPLITLDHESVPKRIVDLLTTFSESESEVVNLIENAPSDST
ncbi:hypothetical protein QR680_002365 [Steinernema hermaphroditum]|uniref:Uncharacterized protein n=1 Tax=Steinernema hermaphroditum TaxID=289476 RepID=A0AA39LI70_9BILA|nr:hypothetical protein QR680_002365 [Steinernema hermaphroditum]